MQAKYSSTRDMLDDDDTTISLYSGASTVTRRADPRNSGILFLSSRVQADQCPEEILELRPFSKACANQREGRESSHGL